MELYVGMDLHSRDVFTGIMGPQGKRVFEKRLKNDLPLIVKTLEPFRGEIKGIAVESTYNWYWLVDGLMEAGYECLHLANPSAIQQYEGLKHTDDRHDAFWLAHLLSLGILPEGYIYPKQERPMRDLLRKRSFLVRQRTANLLSLQSLVERVSGRPIGANKLKQLDPQEVSSLLDEEHLAVYGEVSLKTIRSLTQSIKKIEKVVKAKVRLREPFAYLKTVPGIGDILALTIMLEVGDINRFPKVGNFSSYCRCVASQRLSAGKSKGQGNRKNGNKYLSWAFVEAVQLGRRFSLPLRRYYERKAAQRNDVVAVKALSNKLARACYYIIRDRVPFREEALFC